MPGNSIENFEAELKKKKRFNKQEWIDKLNGPTDYSQDPKIKEMILDYFMSEG